MKLVGRAAHRHAYMRLPMEHRFARHTCEAANGCILWDSSLDKDGYGKFTLQKGVYKRAHHVAWFLKHGAWPARILRHTCDTANCVNPDHLVEGTQADNIADKVSRNRQARGTAHGRAKLTDADVLEMRAARRAGEHYSSLSKRFQVSHSYSCHVCTYRTWRHLP